MPKAPWRWIDRTEPFSALGAPSRPARFVVEQISDTEFRVPPGLGFQYNADGEPPIVVNPETLPKTDFASIPRFMAWLVSRHGRHTPAVLVHDRLVTRGMSFSERTQADRRFLEMMDDLDVPPVQSRLMWTAVTLVTRFEGTARTRLAIVAWGVMAAGGIGLLVWGVAARQPSMIVPALIGPAVGAALWGGQYWAGLVAGCALPPVALPALASLAGYWVYWGVEQAVRVGRRRLPQNQGAQLAGPIGYQGR